MSPQSDSTYDFIVVGGMSERFIVSKSKLQLLVRGEGKIIYALLKLSVTRN